MTTGNQQRGDEEEVLDARVEIRCTSDEKELWREVARAKLSGKKVLSIWARGVLNAAAEKQKPKPK